MKEITLILRFVVIGIMYIILFKLIRIMLLDLKGAKDNHSLFNYAFEVIDAPDLCGISKESVFPIRSHTSIGRKDDNQIIINDPFVSGNHAMVSMEDDKIFIKDLKSTNGTILNGKSIKANGELQELHSGDTLEIGRIIFRIIG